MEWIQSTSEDSIFDPFIRGRLNCCNHLHRYQKDALQNIFDGVMSGKGGRYTVTFPRQSGDFCP